MSNRASIIGLGVVALGIALRAGFFGISLAHIPPSSDESISALQAGQIARGEEFPLLMMAQPYLFPIEAYLAAPLARALPHTALGARLVPALLCLLALGIGLRLLRRWGGWRETWPGLLLLLFPSTYLLTLQSAYFLPGYASLMLFSLLALFLAELRPATARGQVLAAAGAGLIGGLACSGTLLAAPFAAGAAAVAAFGASWRETLRRMVACGAAFAAGTIPYHLAKRLLPGAHAAVSDARSFGEALKWLWEPGLTYTLPSAMGIRAPNFPDNPDAVCLLPSAVKLFAPLWLALMIAATIACAWRLIRRCIRERRLTIETADAFVAAAWACLVLYLLSKRGMSHAFRYLVPGVLAFPFIVAFLYRISGRAARVALGAVAAALALLNVATAAALMQRWSAPRFAANEASLYDIRPVLEFLRSSGLRTGYASYHLAYRLTYVSNGEFLCAQYYNERFFGWPLPYKEAVDRDPAAAYVLAPRFAEKPEPFAQSLAAGGVRCRRDACGDLTVFSGFTQELAVAEERIPAADLRIETTLNPAAAPLLLDGVYGSRWRNGQSQATGMAVTVVLPAPATLTRVTLYYNGYPYDRAQALRVLAAEGDSWKSVAVAPSALDDFVFRNGHPVMGDQCQTIRFAPVQADRLRLQIEEVAPGRDWAVGEIELFRTP